MKILYTRDYWPGWHLGIGMSTRRWTTEHQSDLLLHGLKKMFGTDVVDSPRIWSLYKEDFELKKLRPDMARIALKHEMFGKGMTFIGLLDDEYDHNVDRTEINKKLENHYFDLVIISRIDYSTPHMEKILEHYPKEKIIVVDGCDFPILRWEMLDKCAVYFKRELFINSNKFHPIHYAIPAEKIRHERLRKEKHTAAVIPYDRSTYVFNTEEDYYHDYATSMFGITRKKGGWDAMRHYEILANRCMPVFLDIKHCPKRVCTNLPKKMLKDTLTFYNGRRPEWFMETSAGEAFYDLIENNMHEYFVNNCTTEHLAKYVIDTYHKVVN